jgi:hypothetical protein
MTKKTIVLLAIALAKFVLQYVLASSEYDWHHDEILRLFTIFQTLNKLYTLFIGYYPAAFALKSKLWQLI